MTDEKREEITKHTAGKINIIFFKYPIEEWREKIGNQLREAELFMKNWEVYAEKIEKLKGEE